MRQMCATTLCNRDVGERRYQNNKAEMRELPRRKVVVHLNNYQVELRDRAEARAEARAAEHAQREREERSFDSGSRVCSQPLGRASFDVDMRASAPARDRDIQENEGSRC